MPTRRKRKTRNFIRQHLPIARVSCVHNGPLTDTNTNANGWLVAKANRTRYTKQDKASRSRTKWRTKAPIEEDGKANRNDTEIEDANEKEEEDEELHTPTPANSTS